MVFTEGVVDAAGFSIRYWEAGQGRPMLMLDQTSWQDTMLHDALAEKYQVFSWNYPAWVNQPSTQRLSRWEIWRPWPLPPQLRSLQKNTQLLALLLGLMLPYGMPCNRQTR